MAAESLRDELMQLAGVADAEVDDDADSPTGVRVRLEPDADARLVGIEVQRVLATHGLRSRITGSADEEPAGEAVAGPAGDRPDAEPATDEAVTGAEPEAAPAEPAAPAAPAPPEIPIPPPPAIAPPVAPAPVAVPSGDAAGLASITVEEWADKVEVTATAGDGRTVAQQSGPTRDGLIAAAVSAVGTLAEGTPPELVSVTPIEADGSEALALVLRRSDGSLVAGAAVVKVGTGYAVGRATWSALHSG